MLRLMIYDRHLTGRWYQAGLTLSWWAGGLLFRGARRFDAWRGVSSWEEALEWLASVRPDSPIAEIQFWGHGKWGSARVGTQVLDGRALRNDHALHAPLARVRERIAGPESLWWFRTCETFGAEPGHQFARDWTDFFGCRGAGHTFIIGPWQSGLHSLDAGAEPDWSPEEGLRAGTTAAPTHALWSRPGAPNTIHCLRSRVPSGF